MMDTERKARQVWRIWVIGDALMVLGLVWAMMSAGDDSSLLRIAVFVLIAAASLFLLFRAIRLGQRLVASGDLPEDAAPPPTTMVTAVFVIPALLIALIYL
jgi:hypothetical protein